MTNSEDKITGWFREQSRLDEKKFPIGIGDDMAMVSCEGFAANSFLITTDMLLDGVHFEIESCGIEKAGYKAMAASLSDCAAMASMPVCAVVSVALNKHSDNQSLKQLHAGTIRAGKMFGCELVGGDITSWDSRFTISVTMISRVGNSDPVTRNGAKPGDIICVSGTLGASLLGKHLNFIPRVNEALRLTEISRINSMMDITDGLSIDLDRICRASGVGAEIYADKLPLSYAARQTDDPVKAALNDGEDFELLFTLNKDQHQKLINEWELETEITAIGEITENKQVCLTIGNNKKQLKPKGFDHLNF